MLVSGKKIGVDSGTALVKVVELTKAGGGVTLANWSVMPFRVPPNAPPESASRFQARVIDATIKKCECRYRDVVVGVPGNSAFIRNIKLPPVPGSKIDQIVRYEIQQTIPFPIEHIALDYQVLEPDESSEVEVIMVAMKGEVAESFIRDIERAKVNVAIVDSIPLAIYNCYRFNDYSNKEDCTTIIELGAATSNILVELGGELRYCRNVSIGGNDITSAVAKEFNIPFEQAERLKIQHGLIFPETQESNFTKDQVRVSKAIAGVLDRLMGEIKLTIGYFRSLTGATAISRTVLSGGGSMLKNIRPFLADRLGVQVLILNPFKKVGVPKNLMNARKIAPVLSAAVGLALRNSQECCQLKISLIPPKIKAEKSRRVKLLYNAASFVALSGIIGLVLWRAIPEATDRVELIAALDREIARYEKFEEQLDDLKTQKSLLLSEYEIYSKYPLRAVDPIPVLAVLTDSLKGEAWIKSIIVEKRTVTVSGFIKSDAKVDELKQLGQLRLNLEKYCEEVNSVGSPTETTEGLRFALELKGLSDIPTYLKARRAEEEKPKKQQDEAEKKEA